MIFRAILEQLFIKVHNGEVVRIATFRPEDIVNEGEVFEDRVRQGSVLVFSHGFFKRFRTYCKDIGVPARMVDDGYLLGVPYYSDFPKESLRKTHACTKEEA